MGKRSAGAEVLVAGEMQTSDPRRPALEALYIPNLFSTYSIRYVRDQLRAAYFDASRRLMKSHRLMKEWGA